MEAKCDVSFGSIFIVKKQSFKSSTRMCQFSGIMAGFGSPGCRAPIGCIWALTARKSCKSLYFPDFFLITNIGVFQGLVDGCMWPFCNCLATSLITLSRFSFFSGHCSIHTRFISYPCETNRENPHRGCQRKLKSRMVNTIPSSSKRSQPIRACTTVGKGITVIWQCT